MTKPPTQPAPSPSKDHDNKLGDILRGIVQSNNNLSIKLHMLRKINDKLFVYGGDTVLIDSEKEKGESESKGIVNDIYFALSLQNDLLYSIEQEINSLILL